MRRVPTVDDAARLAAIGQLLTLAVTWSLWGARSAPPNLPVIDALAGIEWGWPLVVVNGLALWRPRAAGLLAAVVLGGAILGDQTRLQPECVSLALLVGALPYGPMGLTLARWHLAALWLWSGLNKALSLGWADGDAAFIADALSSPSLRPVVALAVPASEIGLGVLLAVRKWKVATAAGAAALHLGILATLSPLFADWNSAVWPWNGVLALIGPIVIVLTRRDRGGVRTDPATPLRSRRAPAAIAAAFMLSPVLFYAGTLDTYLAHNLYTGNARSALLCEPGGACASAPFDTWNALNVPLPPEPRLYRAWFRLICVPGQTLVVSGISTRFTDPPTRDEYPCPAAAPDDGGLTR